jgi:putative FmdB family regulatory protein
MPIYEYKCPECGAGFEKFCRSSNRGERQETCPNCGYDQAGRVLSRVGSVRTGGGGGDPSCGPANSGFS